MGTDPDPDPETPSGVLEPTFLIRKPKGFKLLSSCYWGLLVTCHTAHSARVYMRLSHMSLKIQYNF